MRKLGLLAGLLLSAVLAGCVSVQSLHDGVADISAITPKAPLDYSRCVAAGWSKITGQDAPNTTIVDGYSVELSKGRRVDGVLDAVSVGPVTRVSIWYRRHNADRFAKFTALAQSCV
jgi:uncharacterized protein YceK